MFEKTSDVKSKQQVVGSVTVTIYETIEELVEHVDHKVILDLFNKQNTIAMQAKERNAHAPARLGKGKKMELCFNKLSVDEMSSCAGNFEALQELAATKMAEVEADLAAAAPVETVVEEAVEVE